eukprot:scaffold11822_cov120-Isochrysis_galbana.AAC.9
MYPLDLSATAGAGIAPAPAAMAATAMARPQSAKSARRVVPPMTRALDSMPGRKAAVTAGSSRRTRTAISPNLELAVKLCIPII